MPALIAFLTFIALSSANPLPIQDEPEPEVSERMSIDPLMVPGDGDFVDAVRVAGGAELTEALYSEGALTLKGSRRAVETAAAFAEQFSRHATEPPADRRQVTIETRFITIRRSDMLRLPDAIRLQLATTLLSGKPALMADAEALLKANDKAVMVTSPSLTFFEGQEASIMIGGAGSPLDGDFQGLVLDATAAVAEEMIAMRLEGRLVNQAASNDVPAYDFEFDRTFITPSTAMDGPARIVPVVGVLYHDPKGDTGADLLVMVLVRATIVADE